MKRSEINSLVRAASECFAAHGWTLPPKPRWDVTDFGLGDFKRNGLILVNLAEEPEYCEKLMYARRGMATPCHCHARKKEDIISRWGVLHIQLWPGRPDRTMGQPFDVQIDGEKRTLVGGDSVDLQAGQRITLVPGMYHEFAPSSDECIIGEVSTANDDLQDNFFTNPDVGRFSPIVEDEPAFVKLIGQP